MTTVDCAAADGKTQIYNFMHGTPLMVRAADFNAAHAERERLRKDAERYRWLRSRIPGSTYRIMGVIYSEGGAGVDAAVDAAMVAKRGNV